MTFQDITSSAISKAAGILASRKKSIRRGYLTKNPYVKKPLLISCYGFKYKDRILKIPLGDKSYLDVACEAMKWNLAEPLILRVDARKSCLQPKT